MIISFESLCCVYTPVLIVGVSTKPRQTISQKSRAGSRDLEVGGEENHNFKKIFSKKNYKLLQLPNYLMYVSIIIVISHWSKHFLIFCNFHINSFQFYRKIWALGGQRFLRVLLEPTLQKPRFISCSQNRADFLTLAG